jgi:hypothetical protein
MLLLSALRFLLRPPAEVTPQPPSVPAALGTGASLGLLAGLTGTGGGVFLSPLMIWRRWARTQTVSAVAAMFILVNSIAGLAGHVAHTGRLPAVAWPLMAAAMVGGTLGAHLSCHHLTLAMIKRLLSAVLLIASAKLLSV